ncbi:unnamed protein product [Closterium sp. NIES-54]
MAALSTSAAVSARSLSLAASSLNTSTRAAALPAFSGLRSAKAAPAAKYATAHRPSCACASCRQHGVVMASSDITGIQPAAAGGATYYVVNITFPSLGPAVAPVAAVATPATAAASPIVDTTASVADASGSNGSAVQRVKQAALPALATMAEFFPTARQEDDFMHAVALELNKLGFRRDNGIALVNTCRDEVCRPIVNLIDKEFGLSFNVSGLGGLVNCGKTGFKAAMSHSPEFLCDVDGTIKERYIFFAFPHVSVGESGEVGSLLRRGRGKPSSACGALIAIKNDINAGSGPSPDDDDAEYQLLKTKVMEKVQRKKEGELLSLVQVTKAALQAINDDLEKLISLTVDPATADYAVITGVQIHSGNQIQGEPFRTERTCDYIAPHQMYAVVRGKRYDLQLDSSAETPEVAASVN